MGRYREQYLRAFQTLGRELRPADALPADVIAAAEGRLGLRAPKALAEFYRVAGRAEDYTCAFNRLLPPSEWTMDVGELVFMEENQAVVLWGTEAAPDPDDDPPIFQATNEEPLVWERVNGKCSVFLLVMLHWEAAFGGAMPHCSTAAAPSGLVGALDRDWSFVGEVNGMRAYNRHGKAVCFLRWDQGWRIFAGATEGTGLDAIASELVLRWETETA